MRFFVLIVALVSFFESNLFSQQTNSLLWKISGNNLSKPSYLYGTMHSRDKRAHEFGDSVLVKLNECDAVALELLTGEMKENPFAMFDVMMMKDTTLDMLLPDEDYQLVKTHVAENLEMFGMFVDKMKPIFTSVMLSEGMMRNDKAYTVDDFFERKAKENGKRAIGIETMEEQMSALDQISLREQAQMLVEQIKTKNEDSILFEQLMENYKNQDLQAMMKVYKSEEMPEMFDEALVTKRNHTMAHRMDSIIRMQPTFNAVGALHLPGDEGLIELLKKKGYSLTPVFSSYSGTDEPEIYFPEAWITYASKAGKFTMDFPATPEENMEEKGKMNVICKDTDTKVFFIAGYQDLSKEDLRKGEGDYEKGISELQEQLTLISKKEIAYQGMKAADCEFKAMQGVNIRWRFLLVKNRMYMFGVGGSSEFINSAEAEKFYDSLKLN